MYSDENGVPGVREVHGIRIAERTGSQQQQKEQHSGEQQQKSREEEHQEILHQEKAGNPDLIFYTIELGRLLIEKQNIEQSFYAESIITGTEPDSENESEVHGPDLDTVKNRIAEIEQQISNLDYTRHPVETVKDEDIIEFSIGHLRNLEIAYGKYYERTERESEAIHIEDLDRLNNLMAQKKKLLSHISKIHAAIDYDTLRSLPSESQKKIKAIAILSDINLKIRRIIDKENENSVELQNRKEEARVELGKRNAGMRAISKYASIKPDSHYIDTTK